MLDSTVARSFNTLFIQQAILGSLLKLSESNMSQQALIEHLAEASSAPWNPHPKFPGVAMKTLVSSSMTGGSLSQHLVRIDPGCALETHVHPAQCELHLVLNGSGKAWTENQAVDYHPGSLNTIPAGATHAVRAGADGLTLLASFSPAQGQ
jgi:quercetin dioxygenase-like cupin family protein